MLETHSGEISSVVINSGCANACTGAKGESDARDTIKKIEDLGLGKSLVMSTGVIGPFLDMDKIQNGISEASQKVDFLFFFYFYFFFFLLISHI